MGEEDVGKCKEIMNYMLKKEEKIKELDDVKIHNTIDSWI